MYFICKSRMGLQYYLERKSSTNASRGFMILINNNFSCDVGQITTDPDGNFVILELKILDKKLHLQVFMDQMKTSHNFIEI